MPYSLSISNKIHCVHLKRNINTVIVRLLEKQHALWRNNGGKHYAESATIFIGTNSCRSKNAAEFAAEKSRQNAGRSAWMSGRVNSEGGRKGTYPARNSGYSGRWRYSSSHVSHGRPDKKRGWDNPEKGSRARAGSRWNDRLRAVHNAGKEGRRISGETAVMPFCFWPLCLLPFCLSLYFL